ncbi:MAG: SANT/Myb-like DNA-binding domain-containing protein, partial [Rhodospirillaceae bacterium]
HEDRDALAALHAERLSCGEIARRLGRTVEAVANMSRRLGLRRRDTAQPWTAGELATLDRMLDEGRSLRQIAEATGHPRSSVADKLRRLGVTSRRFRRPWSEEERETVLRLHGEGAGLAAIAEALPSRSIDAIQQKLQELVGPAPFRSAQRQRLRLGAAMAVRMASPLPPRQSAPVIRSNLAAEPSPARLAIRLIREKRQAQPAIVVSSTDEMIRWLRSRDFMVLHRPSGWQVDRHVLDDDGALLEFVNTRRTRLNLPPFTTGSAAPILSAASA